MKRFLRYCVLGMVGIGIFSSLGWGAPVSENQVRQTVSAWIEKTSNHFGANRNAQAWEERREVAQSQRRWKGLLERGRSEAFGDEIWQGGGEPSLLHSFSYSGRKSLKKYRI